MLPLDDSTASNAIPIITEYPRPSTKTSSWPKRRWDVWLPFVTVQLALIALSAVLPSRRIESFSCQLMFGIAVAQCMIAGTWLVFGPFRLAWRLLGAPAWILVAAGLAGVSSRPGDGFLAILTAGAAAGLAVALALGLVRLLLGVRLSEPHAAANEKPFQYRLKHLMILTLATSVLLGTGRLIGIQSLRPFMFVGIELLFCAVLGSAWAVSIVPMILVAFGSRTRVQFVVGSSIAAGIALLVPAVAAVVVSQLWSDTASLLTAMAWIGALANIVATIGVWLARYRGIGFVR